MESSPPLSSDLETALHMNAGDGKHSYARNSSVQRSILGKASPVIKNAVNSSLNKFFPQKYVIADLGCSSGPNSLHTISIILDTVSSFCKDKEQTPPEMSVFLNDLPSNDFNNIFSTVTKFYEQLKKEKRSYMDNCFISGMPRSFYGRLFPTESVNFFHSSCSLHWLSQVPEGIENNKGNIYMSRICPDNVYRAYFEEFKKGFTLFLRCRAKELLSNGQMVLTILGRDTVDPATSDCIKVWDLLTKELFQLAAEGLIKEVDIDSFNLPWYNPCYEEVKSIIKEEGSFQIDSLKTFGQNWYTSENETHSYVFDKHTSGQDVANCVRATLESFLVGHFGDAINDEMFARYAKNVAENLAVENIQGTLLVFSLSKKT